MFQELEEELVELCKKYPCVEEIIDEKGNICIVKNPSISILALGKISFFADNIIMIEGPPVIICRDERMKLKLKKAEVDGSYFIRDESFAKLLSHYIKLAPIALYFSDIDKERKYQVGAEITEECCGVRFKFSGKELDDMLTKL